MSTFDNSFDVPINSMNDRVQVGVVEKAIRATFAEVLSEDVTVLVEQPNDKTLRITVVREEDTCGGGYPE